MTRVHITIALPDCLPAAARAIAPVLSMAWRAAVGAWISYRTWGMHPAAPYHGRYALTRAKLRGGVRA